MCEANSPISFDEAEIGIKCAVEACLSLFKIDLLRHEGAGIGPGRGLPGLRLRHLGLRRARLNLFRLLRTRLIPGASGESRGLALLAEIKGRARRFAGTQQAVVLNLTGSGILKLADERRARVIDRSKYAGLRRECETMQRQRSLRTGIAGHSYALSATPQSVDIAARSWAKLK
jgi:hypothetical protein